MADKCSVCDGKTDVRVHNGGFKQGVSTPQRSLGVSNKVRMCAECYEKGLIEIQTEYWKEHIAEQKLRNGD